MTIFADMRNLLFFLLLLLNLKGFTQVAYDQYDFHKPLDIPLVLAANFGELRSNHFHTGIDFKTNHRTGYKIYSIDDGYISRIKVSPWGYGKVVYVDHYNGLTSVYAHCESFNGQVEELAKMIQHKNEHFEFDYYPAKDSLKVKKGQVIAFSGNTGGSTAPHLHFEIRETESEDALNPLLFNFPIKDTRKPRIRGLKVYSLTKEGYRVPHRSKRFSTYASGNSYKVKGDRITLPADFASNSGGIGFAFDAIDQLNAANNICGIHRSFLLVNGDTVFSQNMTRVSFFTNRQINTHKDYEEYHDRRKHFHKSFRTEHNELPIYRKEKNRGIINVKPGNTYDIAYQCFDSYGNNTSISFELRIQEGKQPEKHTLYAGKRKLYPENPYMNIDSTHYLFFPQRLLYEPTPFLFETSEYGSITFGDSEVPLDDYFELMLPVKDADLSSRYYVTHTDHRGRTSALTGNVKDGWINIESREFGTFDVTLDTVGPSIRNYNFRNGDHVGSKKLIWNINDDQTGIYEYDIYIDGKWHLLAWEPKRNTFYFEPNNELQGTKTVKVVASDQCGNTTTVSYELSF